MTTVTASFSYGLYTLVQVCLNTFQVLHSLTPPALPRPNNRHFNPTPARTKRSRIRNRLRPRLSFIDQLSSDTAALRASETTRQ